VQASPDSDIEIDMELYEPPPPQPPTPRVPTASRLSNKRKRTSTPNPPKKIFTCARLRSPRMQMNLDTRLIPCTYTCLECRVFFHNKAKELRKLKEQHQERGKDK